MYISKEEWRPNNEKIKFSRLVYFKREIGLIGLAKLADKYTDWLEEETTKRVASVLGYKAERRLNLSQYKQRTLKGLRLIHSSKSYKFIKM